MVVRLNAVMAFVGTTFAGHVYVVPAAIGIPSVADAVPPVGFTYRVFAVPVFEIERNDLELDAANIVAELVTVVVDVLAVNDNLFGTIDVFIEKLLPTRAVAAESYLPPSPSN